MAEALPNPIADRRSLVFRLGADTLTMDAQNVVEVIKTPVITRVPHGFAALAGIVNLRGIPLPVIALDRLLNRPAQAAPAGLAQRIVVYDHGERLGLLVDDVVQFGALDGIDRLQAVDIEGLLKGVIAPSPASRVGLERLRGVLAPSATVTQVEELRTLLAFRVAGQTFGLPLDSVSEILAWPDDILPSGAASALLGVTAFRDGVLPIFSLAALLGLPAAVGVAADRVVVVDHQGDHVGLAVDQMDAIRRLPADAIDPVPPVLARSAASPVEIEAIGRMDHGRTLISILSVQKLFGNDAVDQVISGRRGATQMAIEAQDTAVERFLIFTLGDETYGLPIGAVDEVIRLPDSITRLPQAPAFVTGVINLRGKALPLIDQRLRFETSATAVAAKPRAIVVTIEKLTAGFIVDGVSEVVAIPVAALSAAPDFASERAAVFDRVAHIAADGRMILLVEPRELLTRAERDIVSALAEPAASATVP